MTEMQARASRRAHRGVRRASVLGAALVLGATTLAACQLPGSTFVVTTTADGVDSAPGDGVCETALGNDLCTVRAAVMEANAATGTNTIELGAGNTYVLGIAGRGEDGGATGDLDIAESVAINGHSTIDAVGTDRVLDVRTGTLILDGPSITGGLLPASASAFGGGIRVGPGAGLLAADTTIHGNWAEYGGGGIGGYGAVTIVSSTVRDNTAAGEFDADPPNIPARGGGVSMYGGSLTVRDSSISSNTIQEHGDGSGLAGDATSTITVERSTVDGNDAGTGGAAIDAASLTLADTTVTDNVGFTAIMASPLTLTHATVVHPTGRAVVARSGSAKGSIIQGPTACDGSITSLGFNLTAGTGCTFAATGDQDVPDPLLIPLDDNGGPTRTRLPYADSAAVDAIPVGTAGLCDATTPADQRGEARPAGPGCDVGAVEGASSTAADPLGLVVDIASDGSDVFSGDGVCETAAGGCSLRAAIEETNVWPQADSITVASGIHPIVGYPLPIADDLELDGAGNEITGSGPYSWGGLTVTTGSVTFDDVHLRGPSGDVLLDGGEVTLADSSARALLVRGPTELHVVRSTLTEGLWTRSGSTSIVQSTIAGLGPAIQSEAYTGAPPTVSVVASTLSSTVGAPNTIRVAGAPAVQVRGSIIEGPASGACSAGAVVSGGYNVISDSTCGPAAVGDQVGTDPLLLPLDDNGGPTATRLPYANSPAINVIPAGTVGLCDAAAPTDQRGVARPAGGACDAGAVEGSSSLSPVAPVSLVVTSALDAGDASPGNGSCASSSGACTLRAAIDEANAWPFADTITVAAGVDPTLTIAGMQENGNRTGDLDLLDSVAIVGGGATIDASRLDGVIDQAVGTSSIEGLTIQGGGTDPNGPSPGINVRPTATALTVQSSVIRQNEEDGILGDARLTVTTSSITDNAHVALRTNTSQPTTIDRSTVVGSGLYGLDLNSAATVTRSTIVAGAWSAIRTIGPTTVITASTVTGTSSSGTIRNDGAGTVTVRGSALSGVGGLTCVGPVASAGYNRHSQNGCAFAKVGDLKAADLLIGPLADNGGPTLTRLPGAGSPLLDIIPAGTAGVCDATFSTDQRGQPRPQGAGCDAGAVERTP